MAKTRDVELTRFRVPVTKRKSGAFNKAGIIPESHLTPGVPPQLLLDFLHIIKRVDIASNRFREQILRMIAAEGCPLAPACQH